MPLDTLIANLFEHSYEHWWMHKHHIKWKVTSVFIRAGFFLTTGRCVMWAARHPGACLIPSH